MRILDSVSSVILNITQFYADVSAQGSPEDLTHLP